MRKLWKILKWTVIGLVAAIAVLLSIVAIVSWRANGRLEQRLNAIRTAGDPVTLSELTREPIHSDRNAVTYLQRVERQVLAINNELRDVLDDDGPYREAGKLNAEGATMVRATLESYSEVIPTLELAANCDEYDSMYDFSAPPAVVLDAVMQRTGPSRAAARVLILKSDLLMFEGQRDEALRTSVLALKLGRQLEHEPFMVGYLVSLGVRGGALDRINQILTDGQISAESSALLKDELARNDGMQGFVHCLKSERALGVASFRNMPRAIQPLWYFKNWESDYLDMMAAEVKMGAAPKHLIAGELSVQSTKIASSYGALVRLSYSALQAGREAMDRVRAQVRCLYVACELQRTALDRGNADDLNIEQLGIDKSFIIDPYTGKRLLTRKSPQGWTVYSVGRNGKDDGGNIGPPFDDVGAGPVTIR
ncbi:MAG TPA: hypothetical protein VMM76_22570 [Pirellulaceae bacterium]|nr:hypothetical protein [Pirellulaceae bacterium]